MEQDLGNVDEKPRNPAVPFLQGREQLCHQDEHRYAGIEVGVRIRREEAVERPSPEKGDDQHRHYHISSLRPAQHADLQRLRVLRALLLRARVRPSPMAEDVDRERHRLQKQAGIQVLVPE